MRWDFSFWSSASIQTKILVPLIMLMLASIVISSISFILSTNTTRNRILDRQIDDDTRRIVSALAQHEQAALESAHLLADVLASMLLEEQDNTLRNESPGIVDRVVPVRDRFRVDQIIVTNAQHKVRANVAPSYLESISVTHYDMLSRCQKTEEQLVTYQTTRLLIVCEPVAFDPDSEAASMLLGNVYTILDLRSLLNRVYHELELVAIPQLLQDDEVMNWQVSSEPPDIAGIFQFGVPVRVRLVSAMLGNGTVNFSLTVDAASINEIVGVGLGVILFSSGLAISISMLTVAVLIRILLMSPLKRLTAVAEQVSAGDLSVRAHVEAQDEIGTLASTFNSTTLQLQELIASLEQRVARRTLELTVTNEQLRQEISERTRAEAQIRRQQLELERLASMDDLTSLYNRRHFFLLGEHQLRAAEAYGHIIAAVMLDIDHFKKINDSYGHPCGDQVLRIVAQRCRKSIRDTDILGRYGGEEFALLLPGTDTEAACAIAERLRSEIATTPIVTDRGHLHVTVSIGVAVATDGELNLDILLGQADAALYVAKRSGRNRVVLAGSRCSDIKSDIVV